MSSPETTDRYAGPAWRAWAAACSASQKQLDAYRAAEAHALSFRQAALAEAGVFGVEDALQQMEIRGADAQP